MKINFKMSSQEVLDRARREIEVVGGVLEGDESGEFTVATRLGQIKGNYKILNDHIDIDVIDRPFLLSDERIEKELRKYLD